MHLPPHLLLPLHLGLETRELVARPPAASWGRAGCALRMPARALVLLALLLTLRPARSWGENLEVPASLQVKLIGTLAAYDRNFRGRVGQSVVVVIVTRPSDHDSTRAALQMQGAFNSLGPIVGLPHEVIIVSWAGAESLSELCARRRVAIVYLTPGLGGAIGSAVKALERRSIWTVAGAVRYVNQGVVLGFELVSAQTKLVINLGQARKQGVSFRADALKLMRIVQ